MHKLFIIFILIIGGAVGFRYYTTKNKTAPNQQSTTVSLQPPSSQGQKPEPIPAPPVTNTVKTYTLAEVAKHVADEENYACWTVIHDKVYDITEYVNHPGGEQIYRICGKDGTELFENRPGKGTPHPQSARDILEKYYIGDLKK